MEKYVLSVCLAADLNYELKTMLHQHQARLDICDSLERAEERIGKQRFCLVVCDTTALPTCQALLCRFVKDIGRRTREEKASQGVS